MEYEANMRITPRPNATGTWQTQIYLLPHPVQPLSAFTTDSLGPTYQGLINPTLTIGAASYSDYGAAFSRLCSSWRMIYASATVDLDAPALANQGSVVAAQYPILGQVFNLSTQAATAPFFSVYPHLKMHDYVANKPTYDNLIQLPGAFSGLAKDGVYMPMRMDPSADWVNAYEPTFIMSNSIDYRYGQLPVSAAGFEGTVFPFHGLQGAATSMKSITAPSVASILGDTCQRIQQPDIGQMAFVNMSVTGALTIRVRWGVEMLVPPTSQLAPTMQPSAPADERALAAYTAIANELPFAFPSSYNGLEQLLPVLRNVWAAVKPVVAAGLGAVPVAGPFLSAGAQMIPSGTRSRVTAGSRAGANSQIRLGGTSRKKPRTLVRR